MVNRWSVQEKLGRAYFAMENSARTWYENREPTFQTWDNFRQKLLETFLSAGRQDLAQQMIEARMQKPNESVAIFAEHMARLFRRADPDMPEARKVRHPMRGVKEPLFAGLVRNLPTTVDEFLKEATVIKRALRQRCRHFDRLPDQTPVGAAAQNAAVSENSLRQMILQILREELRALGLPSNDPPVASVAEIVRQELRQAFPSLARTTRTTSTDLCRRRPPSSVCPRRSTLSATACYLAVVAAGTCAATTSTSDLLVAHCRPSTPLFLLR